LLDAMAECCSSRGNRYPIEKITARDGPVHAEPAIIRSTAHAFAADAFAPALSIKMRLESINREGCTLP
jgi:hypothetical protein